MPLAAQRRQRLLALLRHHGALGTRELAERLEVSEATVRRDLALLARRGLLRREHGGALLPEAEPPYAEKLQRNQRAKEAIAQRAAALVPDGATVVLDSGTTALALARLLAGRPLRPTEVVIPQDGTLANGGCIVAARNAPHPNTAKLFLEFIFSRYGQVLFAKAFVSPIRPDVELPKEVAAKFPPKSAYAKVKFVDYKKEAAVSEALQKYYAETIR